MKVVVTGAAGMIGSNLVHGLNAAGIDDVIAVDDLTDGPKYRNLLGARLADYFDKSEFYGRFSRGELGRIDAVLHQGACSDTMEHNGRYMLDNNYRYSVRLYEYCAANEVPLIYASSAAVYGASKVFKEDDRAAERPLNVYGYSKLLFDQYVRRHARRARAQVAGLRYFNVYGPGEAHKGSMASVAFHLQRQVAEHGEARLFEGSGGYSAGEQRRDFVYVGDVASVNLWLLEHPDVSGIFNVGTGASASFNDVARAIIAGMHKGAIRYIPFPPELAASYQSFTQADISALRAAGYTAPFEDVRAGIASYLDALRSWP